MLPSDQPAPAPVLLFQPPASRPIALAYRRARLLVNENLKSLAALLSKDQPAALHYTCIHSDRLSDDYSLVFCPNRARSTGGSVDIQFCH